MPHRALARHSHSHADASIQMATRRPIAVGCSRRFAKGRELQRQRTERCEAVTPLDAGVHAAAGRMRRRRSTPSSSSGCARRSSSRAWPVPAPLHSARGASAAGHGRRHRREQIVDAVSRPAPAGAHRGDAEAASRPHVALQPERPRHFRRVARARRPYRASPGRRLQRSTRAATSHRRFAVAQSEMPATAERRSSTCGVPSPVADANDSRSTPPSSRTTPLTSRE